MERLAAAAKWVVILSVLEFHYTFSRWGASFCRILVLGSIPKCISNVHIHTSKTNLGP